MTAEELYDMVADVAGKPPSPDALAIALAIDAIAEALHKLGTGDAATPFGAIEALSVAIINVGEQQARALDDIAAAIARIAEQQEAKG